MRISMVCATSILVVGALNGRSVSAQRAMPMVVNLHIVDSAGVAVAGANVSIVAGMNDVIATGVMDSAGRGVLRFEVKPGDYHLVARRVGYARTDRFFHIPVGGTVSLDVTVARLSSPLETVRVTAAEDLKSKSYFIDAEGIATSTRPVVDGWDIVTKLRPDMLTSRMSTANCPGIQEVWVNGQRVRFPPRPTDMALARRRVGVASKARYSITALSVLTEIAAEHIDEMRYRDCFDATEARVGTTNALFITLKDGVEYQIGVGSFVLADILTPR